MSIKHMDMALSTELPLAQKMLLTVLADRANEDGECWPGQASLAKRCSLSERAVRDNLSKLEKLGLVEVINRRVNGRQATSIYRLHIPIQAADCAASNSPHRRQIDANTGGRLTQIQAADCAASIKQPSVKQPSVKQPAPSSARTQEKILWDLTREMFTGISEAQMEEWEQAFPQVDIDSELTRIELWYKANPKKHKRDVKRFITNWLARTFDDLRKPKVFVKPAPQGRPP